MVVLTLIFRAINLPNGHDETQPAHYTADPTDGPVPGQAAAAVPSMLRNGRVEQDRAPVVGRHRAPD